MGHSGSLWLVKKYWKSQYGIQTKFIR